MERNILVDRLKGYACFLVLFGHVIMGVRLAEIPIPSGFAAAEKFIWSFHVALFMFLSGVVYQQTGQWKTRQTKFRFILHKLCSLGIPYAVFSTVYIAINSLVGQTNTQSSLLDICYIWKTPVAQYWFLYALFFLFCIWSVLSGLLPDWGITLVVVSIAYILPLFGIGFGSFDVVFYSALAFGLGTCIPFSVMTKTPLWVKWVVVFAHIATGIILVMMNWIEKPVVEEFMTCFGIYASVMLICLVRDCKPVTAFLDFMSRYSFQVYLLHTIFTAGVRIVLLRMNITWWWLHVILGTAAGIGCSVLAAVIARKFKFLNFFFFPTKK